MTVHQETVHEGTKSFVCDISDYKCSQKTVLKNHIKSIHEGEKRRKCDICNFRSYRAFDMKNHI